MHLTHVENGKYLYGNGERKIHMWKRKTCWDRPVDDASGCCCQLAVELLLPSYLGTGSQVAQRQVLLALGSQRRALH